MKDLKNELKKALDLMELRCEEYGEVHLSKEECKYLLMLINKEVS